MNSQWSPIHFPSTSPYFILMADMKRDITLSNQSLQRSVSIDLIAPGRQSAPSMNEAKRIPAACLVSSLSVLCYTSLTASLSIL